MLEKTGKIITLPVSGPLHVTDMTAEKYRKENNKLMQKYEKRVRKWLADNGKEELSTTIPYFRDGVVCPEKWFAKGNNFRPMIILKEVSLGINQVDELNDFLELWGRPRYFEFVENPFDDIRNGRFKQWRRIARLVKGLEEIYNGAEYYDCDKYDVSFISGGEKYQGNIKGYKTISNERTANPIYNDIVDKMAVVEIKKLGAGQTVNSELSLATKHYTEHIEPFHDLLCYQIELINPTVIICLGREYGSCISDLLKNIKNNTCERLWIDGYHHTRSSNAHFFEEPISVYKDYLNQNKSK